MPPAKSSSDFTQGSFSCDDCHTSGSPPNTATIGQALPSFQ